MTNLWAKLREALARRIRYKITRGGVLFILAILMVGVAAIASANNLLFLILAAMLATLLVSGFVSRLCLAALELDFLVPEHIPAGRSVPGKLYVRNQKWLMPSFSIRVEGIRHPNSPRLKSGIYFPLIAGGATLEETVEVRFPKRGAYRQNSFAFMTSFPFGFLEKSARVTLGREMIVYPSIDPFPGFDDLLAGNDRCGTCARGGLDARCEGTPECVRPWDPCASVANCQVQFMRFPLPSWNELNRPRMDTDAHGLETNLTEAVIGSAFEVSKVLGAGFLEKVYERAMLRELTLRGVSAKTQASFPPCHKGQYVGEHCADLVVDEKVIVELKCVDRLGNEHLAPCIDYWKASGLRVALLINFQRPKVEWKRVLLDP